MSSTVFHCTSLSLLIDHSLSTEAATSSSTKMTLHSLVKELIFRDSEVIMQVFLHFYNQIWQSPLSLVEISFIILCQPPGKETLYSERHILSHLKESLNHSSSLVISLSCYLHPQIIANAKGISWIQITWHFLYHSPILLSCYFLV